MDKPQCKHGLYTCRTILSGFFTNLQYQIKIGQCTTTTIDLAIQGCSNKAYSTDPREIENSVPELRWCVLGLSHNYQTEKITSNLKCEHNY